MSAGAKGGRRKSPAIQESPARQQSRGSKAADTANTSGGIGSRFSHAMICGLARNAYAIQKLTAEQTGIRHLVDLRSNLTITSQHGSLI